MPLIGLPHRNRVVAVSVTVENALGEHRTYSIDPAETMALCWSDAAVHRMLGAFYLTPIMKTRAQLTEALGEKLTRRLMGDSEHLLVTPDVIAKLWDLHEDGTYLSSFLGKSIWVPPTSPENAAPSALDQGRHVA
jgi:hypothetical protein